MELPTFLIRNYLNISPVIIPSRAATFLLLIALRTGVLGARRSSTPTRPASLVPSLSPSPLKRNEPLRLPPHQPCCLLTIGGTSPTENFISYQYPRSCNNYALFASQSRLSLSLPTTENFHSLLNTNQRCEGHIIRQNRLMLLKLVST